MEAYGHKSYSADTDPESFETFWGQPVTTEEMIKGMKASGFDSLRVPVAWTNAMEYEKGDYTIKEAVLPSRVTLTRRLKCISPCGRR